MQAAVVRSFDEPPTYDEFPAPAVSGDGEVDGEVLVRVVAAGLHPRVRSAADGTHYTSEGALPMVPGIDAAALDIIGSGQGSVPAREIAVDGGLFDRWRVATGHW